MADNTTNGIDKGASSEATASVPQPSNPPVAKGPMNAAEESMEPSIATNTATSGAATAPDSETPAQNDTTATADSKELTEKIDAADKLASQPEKPADTVTSEPASTETATADATADAPPVSNGEAKEPPKPVSIEEVRDQDMPEQPQPAEMTGALPVQEPAKDAPKTDTAPAAAEPDKSEANTGEKRKPSESEASNGDVAHEEESPEDAPAEKKQKTNGAAAAAAATTNGAPKKVGRPKKEPKKDKKAPPPVGRTARKTRSQGAAD
ncbi:hypothetical protein Daesc_000755 [Daldinia eschscholtzii]|uniref:Uncharacterized protein n=1 Tax=Daldinia eschscholtzii TaxID=292717 RepID=A0AAX6MZP2_9PEZI